MTEKLASAEIDESRERFEKLGIRKQWDLKRCPDGRYGNVFTAFRWHDWQIAWQAAERDTRERIAQQLREIQPMPEWIPVDADAGHTYKVGFSDAVWACGERIRGVNR